MLHEADIATTNVLDSSNDIVYRRDRTGRAVASDYLRQDIYINRKDKVFYASCADLVTVLGE